MSDEHIDSLLDWVFEPYKSKLNELDREVEKIKRENSSLAEKLIQKGWTVDEIKELIAQATGSIS